MNLEIFYLQTVRVVSARCPNVSAGAATQKRFLKSPYKEAKYLPHYKPEHMFNYYKFWENTGSFHTTNYSSNKWIRKSKYIRNNINKTNIIEDLKI